ncbi:HTH-type transcriptional regulator HmrR [Corynebacterium provencense]|uniref:HTH-type transcriptional regulator HmrR n=2 Tax=Corynebacterium provencense TaxID=1737425 RepID=A0A2Z3YP72_9CORY|nr:HTH-type transcriptional regulator HmrR [Corynebacterium provencense]
MRIAEASEQSGASTRLLRYYEEQGLLAPGRNTSGYRDYSDRDVELARRIRQLLDAGLSTATIRTVLPCLADRAGRLEALCEETVADLPREQVRIEESIETLTASRDAIRAMVVGADQMK